jgi:hypothetical protein
LRSSEEKLDGNEVDEEEEGAKELDLGKTGENLWHLITLKGPKAEYESVIEFLEESIPKLKSKQ